MSCQYNGAERLFNIGSGEGLSLNQLIHLIEDIHGHKLNVVYKSPRSFDVRTNVLSIERAMNHLNWLPVISPEEGINLYYQYLLNHSRSTLDA